MTKRVTPEPQPGIQGKGGVGCPEGREDAGRVGATIQRARQPNHAMESTAFARGCRSIWVRGQGRLHGPTVDLKALHAKIGELTLENDFLEARLARPPC